VGDVVLKAMDEGIDFVVVNFANGDMVGHTGNFEAAVKAVEAVDVQLGRIVEMARVRIMLFVVLPPITVTAKRCVMMRVIPSPIIRSEKYGVL
jgi:2,3-bisphosphoglycerate-independent phosphoglycerate mutase